MHELYRKVKVYSSKEDEQWRTGSYHWEYRRDEQAEVDAERGRRAREMELYGLKPGDRTLSDLEEEIAEIQRRVTG